MPKVFSRRTLEQFEDASTSIPLRQIDRAFESASIATGQDPGGLGGARLTQFRRYVASVDQHDSQQVDRLGDALGALIEHVAVSKEDFLVKAAECDGFSFADDVFRPMGTAPSSFAVARVEDFATIDDRGRRLRLIANENPNDAIGGAKQLVDSVCRTVFRLIGEPASTKTSDLADIAVSTLKAIEPVTVGIDDANSGAALARTCLQHLGAVVAILDELRNVDDSGHGRDGKWKGLSPRHARLAVETAVTFAGFVTETYAERAASETVWQRQNSLMARDLDEILAPALKLSVSR